MLGCAEKIVKRSCQLVLNYTYIYNCVCILVSAGEYVCGLYMTNVRFLLRKLQFPRGPIEERNLFSLNENKIHKFILLRKHERDIRHIYACIFENEDLN